MHTLQIKIIDKVNSPADVKKLNLVEMGQLAGEIRSLVLNKVSQVSGHVGPNLGVAELTIAFHHVFDSPTDKIVWDVSHQSYPHKILTGRKYGFVDKENFHSVTGYTSQHESEHDFFTVGHTSTSISLAVGMAKARDLKKETGNVVALIGDGSLSGGLAFEGLNNAAELNSNLIIILNDNEMSIDENFGGLYRSLAELRATNGEASNNPFKALGFDYRYLEEGNDLEKLIETFRDVKDIGHPIVLHVHTEKGHGYKKATQEKTNYHWRSPFNLETGESLRTASGESYNSIIMDHLIKKVDEDEMKLAAINAAIPGMFGLKDFQAAHPEHYFDVGIAEGHSITFAAGLASQGVKPVVFHSSTFLQRAYDQLSHDLAINELPAVLIIIGGNISGGAVTHNGLFDIPLIKSIPNFNYLAPTSKEELVAMLEWALQQEKGPIAIRLPNGPVVSRENALVDFKSPTYETLRKGKKVAILALGSFLSLGERVAEQMKAETGEDITVINPRSITEVDADTLKELEASHDLIVTLEDGSLAGGFGEQIASFYGASVVKVLNFGAKKEFTDNVPLETLYEQFHLTPELIVKDILDTLA